MPVLRQETIETFISNHFKLFKENFIKRNQVKRSLQRALFYRDITIFGRGLLIRPILWWSPILFTLPFFKFCPSPSPTSTPLLFLLPCFFGWMGDHATFAVLGYTMISWIYIYVKLWYNSTRKTLLSVLCIKVSRRPDTLWFFTSTLILYHLHIQRHTRG